MEGLFFQRLLVYFSAMFNSWFHIRAIAKYLQTVLPEAVINNSYTFQKDELVINFTNVSTIQGLRISFQAPLPYIQPESRLSEPKHKVSLFKNLNGSQIQTVKWHHSDRQILITFKNDMGHLLIQMFGINGNIYFLNNEFLVQDAFQKSRKELTVNPDDFIDHDNLIVTESAFDKTVAMYPELDLDRFLSRLPVPVFSQTLNDEIAQRTRLTGKTLMANLSCDELKKIHQIYRDILSEIDQNRYNIYETPKTVFSLLELQSQPVQPTASYEVIRLANQHYISLFYRSSSLEQLRKDLSNRLTLSLHLLQRKLSRQEKELTNLPTSAEYREWADTLLANIHQIHHSKETTIDLSKLSDPTQHIHIPLNPKYSTAENANKYYQKSRQVDDSRVELQNSIHETQASIHYISDQLNAIDGCDDLKELQAIQRQIPPRFVQQQTSPESEERKPYYHFVIKNLEILIGKSAKDNDLLSFKVARPEDFWFHTEHGPGSHVVVRNPSKQDSLPGESIEIAAGIAAFYSKAKHSDLVPVIYTKRKYIWKRKNMLPGQVFTKFTKSVIVKPYNPKD